jgi:hypothetical protein
MSKKIEFNNEEFGEFMVAPTLPLPNILTRPITPVNLITPTPTLNDFMKSNEKYIIDNKELYKKLIDIETELQTLKNMVKNLHYPIPTYYPIQTNNINNMTSNIRHNSISYDNNNNNNLFNNHILKPNHKYF